MPYGSLSTTMGDSMTTPLYSTTAPTSAPIRIQRKSASIPPPGPPDPPPLTDTSESDSEPNDKDTAKLKPTTLDSSDDRERRLRERIERERKELEAQRNESTIEGKPTPTTNDAAVPQISSVSSGTVIGTTVEISSTIDSASGGHPKLNERGSYVEEPPSGATTLERVKSMKGTNDTEIALVRRINNDLQMAQYVQKFEVASAPPLVNEQQSAGVYQIRSLRFAEAGLRRAFWYMGKSIANHCVLFALIPLILLCLSFISPLLYRSNIQMSSPFPYLLDSARSDRISNGIGIAKASADFNFSNPAFDRIDFRDPDTYAVLLKVDYPKDNILRRDAVLAYTALKKKLDHYPNGEKQFLSRCSAECELERDMVDRVIKKSSQVALTFPETFVSLNRESTNLSKIYLGSTIGGVEIDSDGAISQAQGLLMTFRLAPELDDNNHTLWIRNFRDQISTTSAPNITLYSWSFDTYIVAVIDSLWQMHYMLIASLAIVVLFCFLASFGSNAYSSKPLVGIQIAFVLALSCLGALLVQFSGSRSFDPLMWPIFFIIIGIGLLWLFILHLSWSRYSGAAVHPTEKLAFILSHDGPVVAASAVIILITYLTMGIFAPNLHMSNSFVMLAAGAAILLIFALMYMAVFIFVGGRREAKGVKWYQWCASGDTHFAAPNLTDFDTTSLLSLHNRLIDIRPSLTRRIGAFLSGPSLRYPIVFVCTIYMIFAIWGCTNMKIDLREEDFVPQNSPPAKFKQFYDEMFGKSNEFMEITVENVIDYHDHAVRTAIFEMLEKAVNDGYATRFVSWLNEFMKFEKNSIYDVNPDTFVPVVNLVFLQSESYKRFSSDIVFDRYQTQIAKSRMYIELTQKGIDHRATLVENLLHDGKDNHIPLSINIPSSYSLRHDITILSSGLMILSICLVGLFICSLLLIGQPALSFLLLFTSIATLVETVGYAVHWNVTMNIVTLTMAISCNALTSVVVIAFCYSYSLSGKSQSKVSAKIQYAFQASFLPTLFACVLPVVSYVPLLLVTVPIVIDIWKILLLSSTACLLHYLFFMPNLIQLFSEHFALGCCSSSSCTDCCCDIDDDSSIYYIPTTSRAIHPEEIYAHASYTYSVPKSVNLPPSYLAIGPPSIATSFIADYGSHHTGIIDKPGRQTRRSGRHSESSVAPSESLTPRRQKRHSRRRRDHHSSHHGKDDSIYEAPPSPKITSHSESPQRLRRHVSNQQDTNRPSTGNASINHSDTNRRGGWYGDSSDVRTGQQPSVWSPYSFYTPGARMQQYSARR